jgi:hypothetical protein
MLSVDALRMLDYQLWLRSGEQAATRLHCSQSTVSRNNSQTLALFGLSCHRQAGEWQLRGDQGLLLMERRVHQLARLRCGMAPARNEANFWAVPAFLDPLPEGWEGGVATHVGMARPLQLLRERVIDAWIGSYQPDLPVDDPDLAVFDLCATAVHLVAAVDHPLAHQAELSEEDLSAFPSLALPAGMFPRTEAILRRQGLWRTRVRMKRYRPEVWHGRTEDQVTLTYANCLALNVMPGLVRLDYDLGLTSGEALVVRRDLKDEALIQTLLASLRQRCLQLAERHPDLWPTLTLPVAEALSVQQLEQPLETQGMTA